MIFNLNNLNVILINKFIFKIFDFNEEFYVEWISDYDIMLIV